MAEGPINYSAMLVQPDFTPLLQGLQIGQQHQANEAQQQIAQQQISLRQTEAMRKADSEARWKLDAQDVFAAPTTEKYLRLMSQHPEQLDAIKAGLGEYTQGQRDRNLTAAMEVGGLINAGSIDVAVSKLKDRRGALINSGESTEITDHIIANLESGDPAKITQAKALAGTVIATTLGEKAGPVLDSLGYGARAQDREADNERADRAAERSDRLADLRERVAEASMARGDAASARAERAADRADRKASGGGSTSSGGAYEYRIGADGKLQRRKR